MVVPLMRAVLVVGIVFAVGTVLAMRSAVAVPAGPEGASAAEA